MYGCVSQSIIDYNIGEISYVSNRYVANQKLLSIEESVLVVYIKKAYNAGFPLAIRDLCCQLVMNVYLLVNSCCYSSKFYRRQEVGLA
jgi:hypothetical protein